MERDTLRILYCSRRIFFVYIKHCYDRLQPLFTAWRLRDIPLIKITRSNPENSEVRYSVHAFLRISLPASPFAILANVCEKGNTGNTSWELLGTALWGLSTLIAGIPHHCPDRTPSAYKVPFTFLTLPRAPSRSP